MRSALSTAAIAAILSTAQAAPSIPSMTTTTTDILPGLAPTDPESLATWASARGLAYDPSYKHIPSPSEVHDLRHILLSTPPTTLPLRSPLPALPLNVGKLPSAPSLLPARGINSPDDRYQYSNPSAFPWRAVGKVQWSNGVSCTGQLVGPRHVLTARSCVPRNGEQVSLSFSPAYDKGAPNPDPKFGTAQVGTALYGKDTGGDCGIKLDAAVLIVDRRLGDDLGWFSVEGPTGHFWNQKIWTTLGYPQDKEGGRRPYRQDGSVMPSPGRKTQFACDGWSGPVFSDTDLAPGQIGSAIWKDFGILWGVCSTLISYSDGYSLGGWASGDELYKMVNYTRYNF